MRTTDPTSQRSEAIRRRIHKRTILFVALVVFLPWVLLSAPRDNIGFAGTTGLSINHSQHGWPFVQMHSTHYDLSGGMASGADVKGKPASDDAKLRAIKSFNDFFHSPERNSKYLEFDLRLAKSESGEFGYWSDFENWNFWDEEHHFEIRWLGLLANLLLVFMVAVIVGWPFEKRIRTGNFFQYSLFSIGVFVTLLSIGLTFAVKTYRQYLAEQSYVHDLERLCNEDLLEFCPEYTDRFPRVISQIINGGYEPWGDQQISRTVSDGWVMFDIDDFTDQHMDSVLEVLDRGNFRLQVWMYEYNERTEKYLKQLDAHRIESLYIDYAADLWFEERLGEEFYDMTREAALRKAKIAVNLDLELPHLKEVRIKLNSYFTAKAQLEPFFDLPSATDVFIEGVTDDAARFLLETEERWTEPSNFNWSKNEDLESELEEEMLQCFPHPKPDLGGSNGKVGGVF